MALIYHTSDMAAAIRLMMARNRESMILKKYNNLKRIYLRLNMIEGLDLTIGRPWDSFFDAAIAGWRERGGLLQYHYDKRWPTVPAADAMFIVEAQQGYAEFVRNCQSIRNEIIVYRPPNWDLHKASVEMNFPTSDLIMSVTEIIRALADREPSPRQAAVLAHYYPEPKEPLIPFDPEEVTAILGLSDIHLKRIMARTPGIRNTSTSFYGYSPLVPPDSPDLRQVYDLVLAEPDMHKGERILRNNNLPGPKLGVFRTLNALVRGKYLRSRPKIYVARPAKMKPDYKLIDALAKVAREDLAKLTDLIDNAPEYK